MPSKDPTSLEPSVFTAIRRYWLVVLALILIGTGAGLGATKLIHKEYEATSSVAIAPLAAPLTPNEILHGSTSIQSNAYVNQQTALLQSAEILQSAATMTNTELHLRGTKAETESEAASSVTINPVTQTSVKSGKKASSSGGSQTVVQVISSAPKKAATLANAVVAAYVRSWKTQIATLSSASLSSLQNQITQLTSQLASVTSQLLSEETKLVFAKSTGPNALEESLTTQQSNLNAQIATLDRTKGDIQVNSETDLASPPAVTVSAIHPNPINDSKLRYGGIGAIAGLVIGTVLGYVLALRRRRFETSDDPQRFFGIPILGEVSAFAQTDKEHTVALPVLFDPLGSDAESFRAVATSIRLLRGTDASLAVLISSSRAGAGKTTVVANCGLALGEMGERVLLIDADPVKATLSSTLDIGNQPGAAGLAEVLSGTVPLSEATADVSFGGHCLSLLRPGQKRLALQRWRRQDMAALIKTTTEHYDVILLDGPPLGQLSYAADLAAVVGSTILVVPHRESLSHHAEVSTRLSRTHLLGYVYNRAPRSRHDREYYYYTGTSLEDLSASGSNGPPSPAAVQAKEPAG